MSRINAFRFSGAAAILLALSLGGPIACSGQTFTNYRFIDADPWVTWDGNPGARTYYYSESCGSGTQICVRSSTTLTGIARALKSVVWTAPPCTPVCQANSLEIWRPEIVKLGSTWYIYYSAKSDFNTGSLRKLFVVRSEDGPMGPYSSPTTSGPGWSSPIGAILDGKDFDAYDPNVFYAADGKLYLVYTNSAQISILPLADPVTTAAAQSTLLTQPTQWWEARSGQPAVQGPQGITLYGNTYITYTAGPMNLNNNSAVGLLYNSSHQAGSILDPASWSKQGPIFDYHGGIAGGIYGPGAVVFVPSPDGTEWWALYHGETNQSCDPFITSGCRQIAMQKIYFDQTNGYPILGYPINQGVNIDVPSGENGFHCSAAAPGNCQLIPSWNAAFGDAAEGNTADGIVLGSWTEGKYGDRSTQSNITLGGYNQIFSPWNPNFSSYVAVADMKVNTLGISFASPMYGLLVSYVDVNNGVSVWIDEQSKVARSFARVNGAYASYEACALPSTFSYGSWNTLSVEKSAPAGACSMVDGNPSCESTYFISVNGVQLAGACQGRTFKMLNGSNLGLATQDATASWRNVHLSGDLK
ncbi:MAG: family 43 glycosylhydrolase [Bryobacteraceae bacterium]